MEDVKQLKELIRHHKVLFVDDEEDIRISTKVFLSKFFDNVLICDDGEDALAVFKENKDIDILITDIQMPKMNGVDLAKEIKKLSPKIYTVFITASRGKIQLDESLHDMYITKPISYEDIMSLMNGIKDLK